MICKGRSRAGKAQAQGMPQIANATVKAISTTQRAPGQATSRLHVVDGANPKGHNELIKIFALVTLLIITFHM